jgi:peptidoglycan/xylan/chitin deacetylase (PgdA/CDA1 family)
MNNKIYFTTSWDDGSKYDLKLAELLQKYNIQGTFYVPIKNNERNDILSKNEISEISEYFEIGGHTYSHEVLTSLSLDEVRIEITTGKSEMENILGKEIRSFCFPRGQYKKRHMDIVKEAGFKFARTTGYLRLNNAIDRPKSIMHTTLQVYPHKISTYLKSLVKRKDVEGIKNVLLNYSVINNWQEFSKRLLRQIETHGGGFHLWGHSWEIEENNLWGMFESFLQEVSCMKNFRFCTNNQLWQEYENL